MKNYQKALAFMLGSVLTVSLFAACGGKEGGGEGGGEVGGELYARICYDNLPDDGIEISSEYTQVEIGAIDAGSFRGIINDANVTDQAKIDAIATYSNGVVTAKGPGIVTYTKNGVRGRVEVVPAYVTNPENQYTSYARDFGRDTSELLGNTHDPSMIEVVESNRPAYYIFSTGWEGGNDIRRSTDLIHWEYLGKATHGGDESVLPEEVKGWMKAETTNKISWWAPDIVAAPDGGYWLYTCLVQPDSLMPRLYASDLDGANSPVGAKYSQAAIVLYHTDSLNKYDWKEDSFEYVGVLMQSCIPQGSSVGEIDINSIDPQIIYDENGGMYMAYGSFGTGNWILELDPATGLRKDGVYADGQFKSPGFIRRERNKVVSGDEDVIEGTKYRDDFLAGETVTSDFYGTMISLGAMEAPVIARHDNVTMMDEDENVLEGSGKTYFYTMHSYNWLERAYQMWGGRSESPFGSYKSVNGGLVYNVDVGNAANQGNKYMGAFKWRDESVTEGNMEINIALPGHNDIFTTNTGLDLAAYITRTWDNGSEAFCAQIHQYYLNSYGDIVINPNRYGGEMDRAVTQEELFKYTDNGRFEMVVLANDWDANIQSPGDNAKLTGYNAVSVEVQFTQDGKIMQNNAQIGSWKMYGAGYIKLEFMQATKTFSGKSSGETVYYGVVRPSWLGNRNQSGFTIAAMGHSQDKTSMPIFFNNYSTLTGEGLVG